MTDIHNPMGTDGFEFIEYTAPDPELLRNLFEKMGFPATAKHRSKNVTLHSHGDINFIINAEPGSFARQFARQHGPSICAIAFRVKNAAAAYARVLDLGAQEVESTAGPMELNIPAIEGIGGSRVYLVDRYGDRTIYDVDFLPLELQGTDPRLRRAGAGFKSVPGYTGLTCVDHLTHNVRRGNMDRWAGFYETLFNFRELKYFDIEGKQTGLKSRAMTSPCGKIRIPINESADDKSQIEEYLSEYRGEGIQHVALATDDIYASVDALRRHGVVFQDTPDSYYAGVDRRLPGHGEDLVALQRRRILIDGAPTDGQGILLQIFTGNVIGPIFFEIIQRKGNEGFGEGNFQALFESIELDQVRRGVLTQELP
jgi:4-hydroxyphenylpyruvate dioxygenase